MNSPSLSFPRTHRLTKPAEFQYVFEEAYKVSDQYLVVLSRKNGKNHARLGLAIAKKHSKKAIRRNRIKRSIRESFRHHQQLLCGLDIVVLARPGIDQADHETLRASLSKHWMKIVKRCDTSSSA